MELKSPIYSICFSRDGKFLITGSQDGKVRFWPVETLDELLARGREWLGEKSQDGKVTFWPIETLD